MSNSKPGEQTMGGRKKRISSQRWTSFWLKRANYGPHAVARMIAEMKTRARLHLVVSNLEAYRPEHDDLLAHCVYGHLGRARQGLGVTIKHVS